jgi:ABC-type sugar transport system ATPase subunit
MVGRDLGPGFSPTAGSRAESPSPPAAAGEERLRLQDFSVPFGQGSARLAVEGVALELRAGEVVGLAGLQGSGVSQLLLGLFGSYGANTGGSVYLNGRKTVVGSPQDAIRHGLALLTSDRKATGLVLCRPIRENAVLADLRRLAPGGWRAPARECAAVDALARALGLKAASLEMEAGELSGGNQQKVALAKWIQTGPRVFLLDEPTRGIDVGAKQEIYQLIHEWTTQGIAILMTSTELPELLALSDRVVVLHRGRVTAAFRRGQATAESVLAAAMGVKR